MKSEAHGLLITCYSWLSYICGHRKQQRRLACEKHHSNSTCPAHLGQSERNKQSYAFEASKLARGNPHDVQLESLPSFPLFKPFTEDALADSAEMKG
jgi:hypothetical protein